MRRFLLALSLVLGFGSLAAASAQAQGLSVTFDTGPAYGRPVYGRPVEYRPAPVYRPYPRYRQVEYPPQPAYRPYRYARPAYYGPHCSRGRSGNGTASAGSGSRAKSAARKSPELASTDGRLGRPFSCENRLAPVQIACACGVKAPRVVQHERRQTAQRRAAALRRR